MIGRWYLPVGLALSLYPPSQVNRPEEVSDCVLRAVPALEF
jgi:hypothetical protein